VERQNTFPAGEVDLLAMADVVFPRGLDHHTLMTSPRPLNQVMQRVVRQLAGLGTLPDPEIAERPIPPIVDRRPDLLVVGGGPAGLAAATILGRAGRRVLLVDEQLALGGSLLATLPDGPSRATELSAEARAAGVEALSSSTVVAWYPEDRLADAPPGLH